MNIWWTVIAVAAALLTVAVLAIRRSRTQRLVRLRAAWGAPVLCVRRFDAMAASHAARIAGAPDRPSLGDRTWADLNFDDVFGTLDRTQSTLGQHALYHRLRTAPVADHLEAFEALVQRMSHDAVARERAQVALARLQDPHGYDIWWLAGADAVERHAWYAVFPVLTAGAIGSAALAPFSSIAVVALAALVALNLAVRYVAGRSYYIAEVEALLELVRSSEDSAPHLFVLDELFRGTNAVERIASGQAVLLQLLGPDDATMPHIVLAATHDQELVDLASGRFDAYHFGDAIGPDGLTFDHRLRHGPATTRNAIALLRLHGAPETLLTRAEMTAEILDRQRGGTLIAR